MTDTAAAARCVALTKQYGKGPTAVVALAEVDVAFAQGQFTAIMGPSGSGKSTLMHCMAALDTATSGSVFLGDIELNRLDDKRLTRLRRDRIGFVFQAYNLVPTLTALENITLPADIAGRPVDAAWLDTVIDTLGLRDRLRHRPNELSGGQQQRVACARALAGRPAIIFADEPTGNLDSRSSAEVLSFLRESVRRTGQTVAMVTHDPTAAAYADRVLFLADGRIVDEMADPSAESVLERMKAFDAADAPPAPIVWAPAPAPAVPLAPQAAPAGQPVPSRPAAAVEAMIPASAQPAAVDLAAAPVTPPATAPVPTAHAPSDPVVAPVAAAPVVIETAPAAVREGVRPDFANWSMSDWDAWLNEKATEAVAGTNVPAPLTAGAEGADPARAHGTGATSAAAAPAQRAHQQPHQQQHGRAHNPADPVAHARADGPHDNGQSNGQGDGRSNGRGESDPFSFPPFSPGA